MKFLVGVFSLVLISHTAYSASSTLPLDITTTDATKLTLATNTCSVLQPHLCSVDVKWAANFASSIFVNSSQDPNKKTLFTCSGGSGGTQSAPWIWDSLTYTFELYAVGGCSSIAPNTPAAAKLTFKVGAGTPPPAPPTSGYLKPSYFGFYGAAMNGVGTGNYISQTADFSNVIFVRDDTISATRTKLSQIAAKNKKALLMVQNIFFPWASSKIYADADNRFKNYWSQIAEYQSTVIGFYVYDEPYWANSQPGWGQVPEQTLADALETQGKIIAKYAPGKARALTFAYPELKSTMFWPTQVDWLGFNCYRAYGDVCSTNEIQRYFSFMMSHKTSAQKLIITMDSYWNSSPSSAAEDLVLARIGDWKKLISQNNQIIGVFPFLWQNQPGESLYGAESMPRVTTELKTMGSRMINPSDLYSDIGNTVVVTPPPPPTPPTTCIVLEPTCEGKDYVRRDSCGKEIERWRNAPPPYCP